MGTVIGLVCARSGSQGIPHKNLRRLAGEPLIERAIRIAYEAGVTDVVVATDYRPDVDFDQQGAFHVPRPRFLAGPKVGKWDVWQHATEAWEAETGKSADLVVDVDATRPLRTPETVRAVVRRVMQTEKVCVAVAKADKHPAFDILRWNARTLEPYDHTGNITARQQLPRAYLHAGAYGVPRDVLAEADGLWQTPTDYVVVDRYEAFDVDDELDWRVVELLEAYPPMEVAA